jgi:hypothetical protein
LHDRKLQKTLRKVKSLKDSNHTIRKNKLSALWEGGEHTLLEPKDYRLFHYTPQLECLQDMLAKGIWPRYCVEEFEWLLEHRIYLTFPMACFCDIPLHASTADDNRAIIKLNRALA